MLKFVGVALLSTSALLFGTGEGSISVADKVNLFSVVTSARAMAEADKSSVASIREAEIAITPNAATLGRQTSILIQLFDGKTQEAKLVDVEQRSLSDVTWTGKIEYGAVDGDVVITHRDGFVSGLIFGPTSAYEIVPRGNKHFLVELDQTRFP